MTDAELDLITEELDDLGTVGQWFVGICKAFCVSVFTVSGGYFVGLAIAAIAGLI